MANIYDDIEGSVATAEPPVKSANVYDQIEAQTSGAGNIYDKIESAPPANVYDQIEAPPQPPAQPARPPSQQQAFAMRMLGSSNDLPPSAEVAKVNAGVQAQQPQPDPMAAQPSPAMQGVPDGYTMSPLESKHSYSGEGQAEVQRQLAASRRARDVEDEKAIRKMLTDAATRRVSDQEIQIGKPFGDEMRAGMIEQDVAETMRGIGLHPAAGKEPIGAMEQLGKTRWKEQVPLVGAGETAARLSEQIYLANKDDATQPELRRLREMTEQDQEAGVRGQTLGAKVVEGATQLIPFVPEMVISAGLLPSGRGMARRGAVAATEKLTAKSVAKGVGEAAKFSGQTAGTFMSGRTAANTLQRMVPGVQFSENDAGELQAVIDEPGESLLTALPKGYLDTTIEVLSERAGEGINRGAAALWNRIPKDTKLGAMKMAVAKRWMEATGGTASALRQRLAQVGYNGILTEIGEERLGELLRAPYDGYRTPSGQQLLSELILFSIPGVTVAATGAITDKVKGSQPAAQPAPQPQPAPAQPTAKPADPLYPAQPIPQPEIPAQTPPTAPGIVAPPQVEIPQPAPTPSNLTPAPGASVAPGRALQPAAPEAATATRVEVKRRVTDERTNRERLYDHMAAEPGRRIDEAANRARKQLATQDDPAMMTRRGWEAKSLRRRRGVERRVDDIDAEIDRLRESGSNEATQSRIDELSNERSVLEESPYFPGWSHTDFVRAALANGETLPPNVLAEYPDLSPTRSQGPPDAAKAPEAPRLVQPQLQRPPVAPVAAQPAPAPEQLPPAGPAAIGQGGGEQAVETPLGLDDRYANDDDRVKWIDNTVSVITTLANRNGWKVGDVEKSSRSFSRYVTLDRGDESFRVRVSDHDSGMAGQNADEALTATSRYLGQSWNDVVKRIETPSAPPTPAGQEQGEAVAKPAVTPAPAPPQPAPTQGKQADVLVAAQQPPAGDPQPALPRTGEAQGSFTKGSRVSYQGQFATVNAVPKTGTRVAITLDDGNKRLVKATDLAMSKVQEPKLPDSAIGAEAKPKILSPGDNVTVAAGAAGVLDAGERGVIESVRGKIATVKWGSGLSRKYPVSKLQHAEAAQAVSMAVTSTKKPRPKSPAPSTVPTHRLVDAEGNVVTEHLSEQAAQGEKSRRGGHGLKVERIGEPAASDTGATKKTSIADKMKQAGRRNIEAARKKPGETTLGTIGGGKGSIDPGRFDQYVLGVAQVAAGKIVGAGTKIADAIKEAIVELQIKAADLNERAMRQIRLTTMRLVRAANEVPDHLDAAFAAEQNRLSRRKVGKTIKSQINEAAGVADTTENVPVNPRELLAYSLRHQASASETGWRAGQIELQATQKELLDFAKEHLPKSEQAKAMTAIINARTAGERASAARAINRIIENYGRATAIKDLKKAVRDARDAKLRPEYQQVVDDLTENLDLKRLTPSTLRALKATADFLKDNPDHPVPDYVIERLKRLTAENVHGMTAAEINEIADAINHAIHLNKTKNTLIAQKQARDLKKNVDAIADETAENLDPLKDRRIGPTLRKLLGREPTASDERAPQAGVVRQYLNEWATRFETLLEETSPTLSRVAYESMNEGRNDALTVKQRSYNELEKVMDGDGHSMRSHKTRKWHNELSPVTSESGDVRLSRGERMALAAHAQTKYNRRAIIHNGYTVNRTHRTVRFTGEQLDAVVDGLSADEKAVVKTIKGQMNGWMKDQANGVWVDLYGRAKAIVDDYFPVRRNMKESQTGVPQASLLAKYGRRVLEGAGIWQERTGGNQPLIGLDIFDVWNSHTNAMSSFIGYAKPVRDINVILGNPKIKDVLDRHRGEQFIEYIEQAIDEQANVGIRNLSLIEHATRGLTGAAGRSLLAARVTSAFVQPTSLLVAAADTNPAYLAKALASKPNWKKTHDVAREYSPQWSERYDDYQHVVTGGLSLEHPTVRFGAPPGHYMLAHIRKMDEWTGTVRWRMAELEVQDTHPDLKAGSDAFKQQVARAWERMTNRSDNTSAPIEMSRLLLQARRNPVLAPLVLFSNPSMKMYSMIRSGVTDIGRGDRGKGTKKIALTVTALAMAELIREAWKSLIRHDEEEDDKKRHGFAARVTMRTALSAIELLPGVGDIIASVVRQADARIMRGSSWGLKNENALESLGGDVIDSFVSAAMAVYYGVKDETFKSGPDKGEPKANRELLKLGAALLRLVDLKMGIGIPAWQQYYRDISTWFEEDEKKTGPSRPTPATPSLNRAVPATP